MVSRQEKFLHSRSSRMAKTLTFRPFLVVSALKLYLFFHCFPFFFLLRKKVIGQRPPRRPCVAGPDFTPFSSVSIVILSK